MLMLMIGLRALFEPSLQSDATVYASDDSNLILAFLQTMLALGFVCAAAYVFLRWILPRLQRPKSPKNLIRIVDAATLEPNKTLYVVEVAGKWMALASSGSGVQLISELDAEAVERSLNEQVANQLAPKPFNGAFNNVAENIARLVSKRR